MVSVHRFKPQSEFLTNEGCHIVELRNAEADPGCSIARARVGANSHETGEREQRYRRWKG